MFYEDVLALKLKQARNILNNAHTENFKIGFKNLTPSNKKRIKILEKIVKEQEKAIKYLHMWTDELT